MGGYDKFISGLGLGSTAAIAAATFAPGIGAGMPISSAFAWHTVMMMLGFAVFLSLGRRAYKMELPDMVALNMGTSKQGRRMLHVSLMVTATLCVALGYAGIFIAHSPSKEFFGYDFSKQEWKPVSRILHVYLGYAAIALVLSQVLIGAVKIQPPQDGLAKIRFHDLAKFLTPYVHCIGLMAICAGAYILPCSPILRAIAAGSVITIGVLVNKASSEEEKALSQDLFEGVEMQ